MVEGDKLYKYIGLGVIGIVFVYIILRTLKFQLNVIEGLTATTNPTNSATAAVITAINNVSLAINNNTTVVEDSMHINKYKKNYEDIIIELDKNIDFFLLQTIIQNAEKISGNPVSADAIKTIGTINALKQFKDSLNEGMTFLNSGATAATPAES